MLFFFKNFFIFFSIIEFTPLINTFDYQNDIFLNNFLFFFITCFFLNYYLNQSIKYNLNFDLLYKYFYFFFKKPSFLFNYLLNTFKKIFLYLFHFKYKPIRLTTIIFLKYYFSDFNLTWRPLFKKTSYFGYFRSNRSKWIK